MATHYVMIGWYSSGELVTSHSLPAGRAVELLGNLPAEKIANEQPYLDARYATKAWPGLRRTLADQDAALAAEATSLAA